jgi:flagellar biosynthesis protein FliP
VILHLVDISYTESGESVMSISEIIAITLMILNIILSILTGRKLASLVHDSMLAKKRLGKKLTGFAYLPVYILFIFILLINILYTIFSKGVTILFNLVLAEIGFIASPYSQVVLSVLLIITSYVYYHIRFKNVEKPLTRQGRFLLG